MAWTPFPFLSIKFWFISSFFTFYRYKVIGNNCQDWVEWLLSEIDPELAQAMYERGVRKVSETFLGHVVKQQERLD